MKNVLLLVLLAVLLVPAILFSKSKETTTERRKKAESKIVWSERTNLTSQYMSVGDDYPSILSKMSADGFERAYGKIGKDGYGVYRFTRETGDAKYDELSFQVSPRGTISFID